MRITICRVPYINQKEGHEGMLFKRHGSHRWQALKNHLFGPVYISTGYIYIESEMVYTPYKSPQARQTQSHAIKTGHET